MKKTTTRAFTVLELVIAIFVVAIIAAVLIPTFSNLIRRAQTASDMQLIKNLNTALMTDAVIHGKHKTMTSALEVAYEYGYEVENIKSSAYGNEILWDGVNDVFCYYDANSSSLNKIDYIPEMNFDVYAPEMMEYQYWKIYSQDEDIPSSQKYSIYLSDGYTRGVPSFFTVGVDVGNNTDIDINYVRSGAAQSVVIRTNGGVLTVDAPADTVSHYGFSTAVNILDVASDCYHENGTVCRLIYKDNDGSIAFNDGALIYCYMNTSGDDAANESEIKNSGAVVYTFANGNETRPYSDRPVSNVNGIVNVSDCHNHDEYDEIHNVNGIYLICKYCGGYTKITTDGDSASIENSSGITGANAFDYEYAPYITITPDTPDTTEITETTETTESTEAPITPISVGVVRLESTGLPYSSLEEAIDAATAHGGESETLTLLADLTGDFVVKSARSVTNQSITIDGQGIYSIEIDGALADSPFLTADFDGANTCVSFKNVSVLGNGSKIGLSVKADNNSTAFSLVNTYGTVLFCDITIDTSYVGADAAAYRALYVWDGVTTLGDGAVLFTSRNDRYCSCGGGAYVDSGASLVLNEGSEIGGFKATYGGGVMNYGSLALNGGEIKGNTAATSGGGVYVCGADATLNISDGMIYNNSADYGGGVYVEAGIMSMNGGSIKSNTVIAKGGGVYVNAATLNVSKGSIDSNTANSGGNSWYRTNGSVVIGGNIKTANSDNQNIDIK